MEESKLMDTTGIWVALAVGPGGARLRPPTTSTPYPVLRTPYSVAVLVTRDYVVDRSLAEPTNQVT